MHLILVRHGETAWSKSGQYTGSTDLELLDEGAAQARAIGPLIRRALGGADPAYIFTSPLKRAVDTARLAWPRHEAAPCDALRECDYGAYEGLTRAQVRARRPNWDFWSDGCLDGESADQVGARADAFLGSLGDREGPILAFSHGHMIRILAARALGLSADQGRLFALSTASVSVIREEYGKPAIALWNETAG
jgi:broad specificity phosphatase PhoE